MTSGRRAKAERAAAEAEAQRMQELRTETEARHPLPPAHPASALSLGRGRRHPLGDYAGARVAWERDLKRAMQAEIDRVRAEAEDPTTDRSPT